MSFRHDGGLLVRGGENRVAVIEGLHHIPDKGNELIGFGLAGETADFQNAFQGVDKYITRLNIGDITIYDLNFHFESRAQRV